MAAAAVRPAAANNNADSDGDKDNNNDYDDDDDDVNLDGIDIANLDLSNLDMDEDDEEEAAAALAATAAGATARKKKTPSAVAASNIATKGDDGDAGEEQEQEQEQEEAEEEDDDEEDEEPKLKYQRLGPGIADLLKQDVAACFAVHDKFLALGTHWGMIYILDFNGNEIKRFPSHTATINDLSIDGNGDFIASCSDDGKVVVNALFSNEGQQVFVYKRPVKAVSLDPDFSRKNTRQLVSGGLASQLVLNEKGWFGNKDVVLHAGEGPIYAIKWEGSLIAWGNDMGVKIYDTTTKQRITFIERPKGSPRADMYHCCLCWKSESVLLIGWADSVKIARIKEKPRGGTGTDAALPSRYAEIICIFQTDYFISGIAPFNDYLVILAFAEDPASSDLKKPNQKTLAQRPELRIVTFRNEDISSDALPVNGFEHYQAKDYRLEHIASENLFYVISPKDIVLARPRDVDDHITWLLDRQRFDEALAAAEKSEAQLVHHKELDIGQKYIKHLITIGDFDGAAKLCPKVLRNNESLWEHWAYIFMEIKQYRALCPYIPTKDPKLSPAIYEMVLNNFLHDENGVTQAQTFLKTIREWPTGLYNIQTIISAVLDRLQKEPNNTVLMDALAVLYTNDEKYDKALQILLRLRRGNVFELIKKHNLFGAIQDKIVALMQFDEDKQAVNAATAVAEASSDGKGTSHKPEDDDIEGRPAVSMLIKNTDKIPLKGYPKLCHIYLNALFQKDPHIGSSFHEMQVELYAEYDRPKLLPFLRQSNYYPLEKALRICQDRDLVPEMVFILGRMGNNKQALNLIIEKLGDVEQAIDFAKEQNDDELWEDLIKYSMDKPVFIIGLLQNVGSHVDPIKLIKRIPKGLEIPGLRVALIKILQDYNLQMSLREGCRQILTTDCVTLLEKLNKEQKRGYLTEENTADSTSQRKIFQDTSKNFVVFFCGHTFFESSLSSQAGGHGRASSGAYGSSSSSSDLYCPICLSSQTRRTNDSRKNSIYTSRR